MRKKDSLFKEHLYTIEILKFNIKQNYLIIENYYQLKATEKFNDFLRNESNKANKLSWSLFDRHTQRQLRKIGFIGTAVLEGGDGLKVFTII